MTRQNEAERLKTTRIGKKILVILSLGIGIAIVVGAIVALAARSIGAAKDEWIMIDGGAGTQCALGDPYRFYYRPGADDDKLMIYFQLGGACWSGLSCQPLSPVYDKRVTERELRWYGGIFDFENPDNPVTGYYIVMIPYCTGDVHIGAAEVEYDTIPGDALKVAHYGYTNTMSVLSWVYERFEAPDHILIAGSSAGSMASIYYAPEVMTHYPGARIVQLGDGYVGVAPAGWGALETWNAFANLPDEIAALANIDPKTFTITDLYRAVADHYPQHTFAQYTHSADVVQMGYLLVTGGDPASWADEKAHYLEELSTLDNFRYYVGEGVLHTILTLDQFYTMEVNGVRFRDWFADLISGVDVPNVSCSRGTPTCP